MTKLQIFTICPKFHIFKKTVIFTVYLELFRPTASSLHSCHFMAGICKECTFLFLPVVSRECDCNPCDITSSRANTYHTQIMERGFYRLEDDLDNLLFWKKNAHTCISFSQRILWFFFFFFNFYIKNVIVILGSHSNEQNQAYHFVLIKRFLDSLMEKNKTKQNKRKQNKKTSFVKYFLCFYIKSREWKVISNRTTFQSIK